MHHNFESAAFDQDGPKAYLIQRLLVARLPISAPLDRSRKALYDARYARSETTHMVKLALYEVRAGDHEGFSPAAFGVRRLERAAVHPVRELGG